MKLVTLASLFVLLFALTCFAQAEGSLRIASASPYDRVAPGQIIELRVEGFDQQLLSPPPGDALRVLVTQDGSTKTARARTAAPVMIRETPTDASASAPVSLKMFQGLTFVVPRGLHVGEAEVVVSFRGRKSAPFKLNVVERPLRPVVGGTPIKTIAPASIPMPPPAGTVATRANMGLRFERGAKGVEIYVRPLADPDDAEAGVLVRFKQGGAFYDANARVVHREGGREDLPGGGFRLMTPRDVLEVDVPEMLAPGEAEIEITLRAGGQTGEAALVPVTVTDAERAFESPKEAAPRMLAVTPRRVGAGQALMISVDRRRALDPDPSKATVVFEAPDGTRVNVKPEFNSAVRAPDASPDAPAFLIVRAPKEMTGDVRVRLLNPAREEYAGAASEPVQVEIASEVIAPELLDVAEAGEAEISHLQQLSAAQSKDPRVRPVYDSSARYVSIRATGLDPNPEFLRVRIEQEGRAPVTLGRGDFALFSHNSLIVRAPKGFRPGTVRLTIENRGANGYSAPVVRTFELSERR
ncbi:MAG: hypothetical protein QOH49_4097 [Acidobacteriota bacterium]|jgi:hypothetical protein|nr:hypothetical protein [Acidobacteriota bacterium]